MTTLTKENSKELCLRLLRSETEEEVIEVLQHFDLWDDRPSWKPYGDIANNRGIVSNQQSEPIAALVEKLVNSIDAVLTLECYRSGVDPKSEKAPQSMKEAVQRFFSIKDGRIQTLSSTERTRIAQKVQLVACGTKESPAYMIIDEGEGQSPDRFPHTFLSLVKENKSGIPFVQGKFNMGGSGVLQFSGRNSFQLIISKRNPDSAGNESDKGKWGFTMIRRIRPDKDHPHSMYVYLAPNGIVPRFDSETLPLRPGKYPEPYGEDIESGSCIKIWNYKLHKGQKSIATLDLRYALEQFLPEPVLPVRISERRPQYRAHSYETTMSGLSAVLSDKSDDIEFSDSSPLKIPTVGDIQVRAVIIKELDNPDALQRYPAGLLYVINGQLHGYENKGFLAKKTKFDYLASSLIVIADCTQLPQEVQEDVFMASRDRTREIDEKIAIQDALIDYLRDHPTIRQLNALRRQKRQDSAISQEETAKILQNLVKQDPSLANLFGKGTLIRVPGGVISDPTTFVGKRFPTYFRIHNEPSGGLTKNCPIDRTCHIQFETDAENGYFDRLEDAGHVISHGIPQKISQSLGNGKAVFKFGLPANISVGDDFKVKIEIHDISRVEPFVSEIRIHVEGEAGPSPEPGPYVPRGAALAGLPEIRKVFRDGWTKEEFTEVSALKVKHSGQDDENFDMVLNMDNIYLRNEIAKRKDVDAKLLSYWYEWGIVLIALGIINSELRKLEAAKKLEGEETTVEGSDIFERVSRASEGIAITLIPVIAHMSKKTLGE